MSRLLRRYGKAFLPMFLLAVVVLSVRAVSELALPDLMSRIVDVGIAQGGVEYTVPEILTEDGFYRILGMLRYETAAAEFVSFFAPQDGGYILDVSVSDVSEDLQGQLAYVMARLYSEDYFEEGLVVPHAKNFIRAEMAAMEVDLGRHQLDFVFRIGGIMIGVTLLGSAASILLHFLAARIAAGIARRVRADIFSKVTSFTSGEYNQFSTASLITRSTNDVEQVQMLIGMAIRMVIFSPIMAVGGIMMVMGTDASMVWIIALAVGLIVALITIFIIIATPKFKIVQQLIDKVNLVTREGLTGMMVIRAFTTQNHEVKRFEKVNNDLKKTQLFLARLGVFPMSLINLLMNMIIILIVWVAAGSINLGNLQVGDMMAFIQYAMFVVMSFLMFAFIIIMLPRAQVAAKRIMEVLNTSIDICDPQNPVEIDNHRGHVEFRDVSFKFPGAEGYALSNITFAAESGNVTAFIGSTGSGKTALVNLIPRFFEATEGEVLVNGVNVKDTTQERLRNIIGYIPQKAVLFSGTIESNIKYAGEDISDDVMKRAARIAQAEEFIIEKTDKFDEEISQGGTNVSGGQRQRLAIARAIAKDPAIYIFDDSFSALDYKTDAKLRSAIQNEISSATLIVVAQRIGTIKSADQIIVLDQGRIVGKGTHRQLLKDCEVYRQIAHSQLSEEELAKDLEART